MRRTGANVAACLASALAPALGFRSSFGDGPRGKGVRRVSCQSPVVRDVDVLVIGGGIAGTSAALYAAKAGKRVLLVERQTVGSGSTGMSAATLGCWGDGDGSYGKAALAAATIEALRDLQASGRDCGLTECGSLELIRSQYELDHTRPGAEALRSKGYNVSLISASEAAAREPALAGAPNLLAAVHLPLSAYCDPGLAVAALGETAGDAGVEMLEGYSLTMASTDASSGDLRWHAALSANIGGEVLEVRCKNVVLATGAWAPETARLLGVELPVVRMKAQMWAADIGAGASRLSHIIYSASSLVYWAQNQHDELSGIPNAMTHQAPGERLVHHIYGRPGADGEGVWFGGDRIPLGPGPVSDADFTVDEQASAENFAHVSRALPALRLGGQEPGAWCGVLGATLDSGPLVGEVPFLPGLWLCTGFGGSGYMQGVGAGAAVAGWIAGGEAARTATERFWAVRLAADPGRCALVRPA